MSSLPNPPLDNSMVDVLNQLDVIVWKADLHRHFTFVSSGAERVLGYPVQQWLDNSNFWADHIHPDDREGVMRAWQACLTDRCDYQIEYRMLAPDGRSVWLRDSVRVINDENDSPAQLVGMAIDVSSEKIKEEKFRLERLRYEQMAENIQELFWMTELPSHNAIYVSPAFKTITGYDPENLVRNPLSYRDIIHPEDRDRVLAQSRAAERSGKFNEQFRIVRADGAIRWVSVRGFPVHDRNGNIYRIAGVLQDITARRESEWALRESEDRYRDLVEHSQDLICTHDLQGRLLSCNPAPARLLGYSVDELLHIPMQELLAPEARALFPEYLDRVRRDGCAEGLMVLMTRSGERRYWQYRNSLRAEGVPQAIVRGMAHDVSEQLRAEKALQKSEERFRVAVKNAHIMVATQNRQLRYTWVYNPILAWAERECLDKSDSDLLHPEDAYRLKAIKKWVLDTGTGSRTGVQIVFRKRKYYLDLTVEPLFDQNGSVSGITCACTDVTELHDKAERLQLLLEINVALISKLDLPDLLQVLSSCLQRLFRHDFISMSIRHPLQATVTNYPLDNESLRLVRLDTPVPAAQSLSAEALKTGEVQVIGSAEIDNAKSEFLGNSFEPSLRSLACIPVETSKGRLATLNLGSYRANAFSSADYYLMQQLGLILAKAMDNADAFAALRSLRDRLQEETCYLRQEFAAGSSNEMIGESAVFQYVRSLTEAVACTDSTVILQGEYGVGKELCARVIHRMSDRRDRTLIKINCGAIPKEQLHREIFSASGNAASLTGVDNNLFRIGLAHDSTLFLEQIEELTAEAQQSLLRLIEEQRSDLPGENLAVPLNIRLIVATSANLKDLVDAGRLRSDLYNELNVFPIYIPPLRERREDIPMLAAHFVKKHSIRMNRPVPTIPEPILTALTEWDWPGNVQELENFLERSVILTKGSELEAPLWELGWPQNQPLTNMLAKVEREHIVRTLLATSGTIVGPHGAAARLGLKAGALKSRIQQLGIRPPARS